ncbi:hypothetical protein [Candidatus Sororendozoicomonas aggregata]|uniref:hypothetical protein n=1 Tax=Candidatus Sororendozoicomonas aggregata TaxID=3073239 RepID=UPI002ED04C99
MLTKFFSFGASYIPGLSWKSNMPEHALETLETLETLATISWLSVRSNYDASLPGKHRMALVAAKIPRMLHPNNPPYGIFTTLPELNKERARSPLGSFAVEPMQALAVYAMMGLRAPGNIWSNLPGFSYRRFLKNNGSGYGHMFRVKSTLFSSARVFGSYEPQEEKGVLYLFFPTLGEYYSTEADYYAVNALDSIERDYIGGMNINSCDFLCDVRRFIFE